jgi:hypothetical protein
VERGAVFARKNVFTHSGRAICWIYERMDLICYLSVQAIHGSELMYAAVTSATDVTPGIMYRAHASMFIIEGVWIDISWTLPWVSDLIR